MPGCRRSLPFDARTLTGDNPGIRRALFPWSIMRYTSHLLCTLLAAYLSALPTLSSAQAKTVNLWSGQLKLSVPKTAGKAKKLTGNFEVKIEGSTITPTLIRPGEVAHFALRRGGFTVIATDPVYPTLTKEQSFTTDLQRINYITVNKSDGVITIARTNSGF